MNNATRQALFVAQVQNTRELETAVKMVRRSVHDGLRTGNDVHVRVQTKVLAQVFCAWAEANFLKVVHTPHGFALAEITEVKRLWKECGLADGWEKAVRLGLAKVPARKSNFVPNAQQAIIRAIDAYVREPALIRNKVAHGQWLIALNRGNNAVNQNITKSLSELTIVDVDRWHGCHKRLAQIVESLIESPARTFARDYWPQLQELEAFHDQAQAWTLQDRTVSLKAKYTRHVASAVRISGNLEARLRGWIEAQPEPKPSKPDAIKRLLESSLNGGA
jgi:hypothetical protein